MKKQSRAERVPKPLSGLDYESANGPRVDLRSSVLGELRTPSSKGARHSSETQMLSRSWSDGRA